MTLRLSKGKFKIKDKMSQIGFKKDSELFIPHITVAKINIDENPQAPANFSIRSIPTMILFKDGSMADAKIGLGSEADLRNWINSKL